MEVEIGGELVARSSRALRADEDDRPARYCFPCADAKLAQLLLSGRAA